MESALPISSFGIQQATACGEPRYFRLKKNLLIAFFILHIIGNIYIIALGQEAVAITESAERTIQSKIMETEGQMATGDEAGKETEILLEKTVRIEKTVIAIYVIATVIDLIFLYGVWTERVTVAKVIAILETLYAAFRIYTFLLGTSSFLLTGLTIGLAVLSVLYWIDLKNMATNV